jgi:NADH-quinone oxidoreductase subunit J
VLIELCIALLGTGLKALDTDGAPYQAGFGTPEAIGEALLTKFLLPFELASILLTIAAVGAVVLARRRGGVHEEEMRVSAMAFLLPPGTGTMAEAVEGRTGTQAHRTLGPPAGTGEPRADGGDASDGTAAGAGAAEREGVR